MIILANHNPSFTFVKKLKRPEMKNLLLSLSLCLFLANGFHSQTLTQTVRGNIKDKESGFQLPGVVIILKGDTSGKINSMSDAEGNFILTGVPVGRRTFIMSYTGYKTWVATDVIVVSGKETFLTVEMEEESMKLDEVKVVGENKGVFNDMSSVSTKLFSIEETERYAGSRNDPARMASNFAGVQGSNDSRNDIVVRGNSPSGILWRLEEIDIPNPNHFASQGSAGGPVAIINNKYLSNSEFFTGAFPSFYGNAMGGVFDLRMRNGNNQKHERNFQLGFLGTEVGLEGPISKEKGSSYLVNYRYSTLDLFQSFKIKIGTSAVPRYQDIGFRFNFPTKKAGTFSFSGIGGISKIDLVLSKDTVKPTELYGDQNRDQYFGTNMGVAILNHVYSLNERTLLKSSVAFSVQEINSDHRLILRDTNYHADDTLPQVLDSRILESKATLTSFIKRKINSRNSFKTGFYLNYFMLDYFDRAKINSVYETSTTAIYNKDWKQRMNSKANYILAQPFFNYTYKFGKGFTLNTGVFGQWMSLNNSYAVEPRAGIKWSINDKNLLSFGYGMHSQAQTNYIYFTAPDSLNLGGNIVANTSRILANKDLGLSKAQHFVLGYDLFPAKFLRIKVETYYQQLWNIPVYTVPSSVSLLNRGASFTRFFPIYDMENKGTGYNYGAELTIEKLFSKHYFFMFSGSVFNSRYKGSNGVENSTDYNGRFATNLLGGVEYALGKKKKNTISAGLKLTYAGGRLYSDIDTVASNRIMEIVAEDEGTNVHQFADYFRTDLRVSYKINAKKASWEIAVDLVNITNQKNILAMSYAPDPTNPSKAPFAVNYQLGFLPIFYVKVDF
jgi:hypothetical protein